MRSFRHNFFTSSAINTLQNTYTYKFNLCMEFWGICISCFSLAVLTGIILVMHYTPNIDLVFQVGTYNA